MATKAQLINFIMEMFAESDGGEVSRSKLDAYKKADLEKFIADRGCTAELEAWLEAQQ